MFDNDLMFRTSGDLKASESNGPLTIRSTPLDGMAARVVQPSDAETNTGSSDTILPKYYGSDDNSTYVLFAQYDGGAQTASNGQELITPIVTDYKYVKEEIVVSGTTTNFGVVVSGLVMGVGKDWDRSVSFE